jgi:hypothetical protein
LTKRTAAIDQIAPQRLTKRTAAIDQTQRSDLGALPDDLQNAPNLAGSPPACVAALNWLQHTENGIKSGKYNVYFANN